MRQHLTIVAICALFVFLFATPAYTQPTCTGFATLPTQAAGTGPLTALLTPGTPPTPATWAFRLSGWNFFNYANQLQAAAGVFTTTTGLSRALNPITEGLGRRQTDREQPRHGRADQFRIQRDLRN